jgi:predicted RNase H-like HicB family nuclease
MPEEDRMMIMEIETTPSQTQPVIDWGWEKDNLSAGSPRFGYRCEMRIQPDEDGGFVAYVPQLRGVVSQGEDEDSAFSNCVEALRAILGSYKAEGKAIPWSNTTEERTTQELSRWIVVNA